jgi:putative peptidoglycan lipid II flippase
MTGRRTTGRRTTGRRTTGRRTTGQRRTTRRPATWKPALLVLLGLVGLVTDVLAGPAGQAAAAMRGTAGPLPVIVSLASVRPTALTPDTELTVTGTVHNSGTTTVSSPQVVLRLDWRTITDRRELAAWADLDPRDPANGTKQAGVPLGRPLAPGETAPFAVSVQGDALQLPVSADSFGPRRMSVEIQDGLPSGGPRVGIARTFAVWDPVHQYRPTRLALLVPVTQGHQPVDPTGSGGQVPHLWAPTGRVRRVLAATSDPAFSYALDPALLNAAVADQNPAQPTRPRWTPPPSTTASSGSPQPAAGPATSRPAGTPASPGTASPGTASPGTASPGTASPGTAGPGAPDPTHGTFDPAVAANARAVLERLMAATKDREVLTLPYADPDVAALGNGHRNVLDIADAEAALVTAETVGRSLAGKLVWPAENRIDTQTAGLAADVPGRRLVLPSSAVVTARGAGGASPVHARMTVPGGTAEVLFTDNTLSTGLAATGGTGAVLATQRLLAETAAITAARPADSPVVLATVPRDWNPDERGVIAAVGTLRTAGWLQLDRLAAAVEAPAVALGRARLATPTAAPSAELPAGHVRIIAQQLNHLSDFSAALDRTGLNEVIRPVRRSALEMLSTSWISRQKGVGPARGVLTREVTYLYQEGVTVVTGSSVNLLTRSGQVTITVANRLDQAVTVDLRLHATNGRVVVKTPVTVDLEPYKSQNVLAQLQAVANGEVDVEARLATPGRTGVTIGPTEVITVRVNYDWESHWLPWIVGGLLLLLVAGLVRGVRRGRVRVSPDSVPDPDDVGREPVGTRAGPGAEPPDVATDRKGGTGDEPPDGTGDEPPDGAGGVVSSSAVMAAGTLVSRVLGMVRAAVLAWAIGIKGLSPDAFATANTLPNSIMILIAGGVLNAVLVPQIVRAAKQRDGGQDYLDRLLTLAILVLGGATLLATAAAPVFVWMYGGSGSPAKVELTAAFAVWCLPQIFFYGLYTIYGQVLNARGSFGPYMWAPVVNNVVAIAGTLVFVALYGYGVKPPEWWGADSIAVLAGTATLGIVAQALVLLPAMRRSGYRWRPRWGWRGVGLRTAGRVAGWTFAGAAVGQLVGFAFVSRAANRAGDLGEALGDPVSGRSLYDNAFLLFMLPHSLIAVSLVTAVFTRISASASEDRTDDVRADVSLATRLIGVATVLATVAMIVQCRDLARAAFPGSPVSETDALGLVMATMLLGLVPFSAQYLFSRVFYAYEDARTPFWISVATVTVWAVGSTLSAAMLAPGWIVPGIGVSMSLSNLLGAVLSVIVLRRRLGGIDGRAVLRTHVRLAVATAVAGGLGWLASTGVHRAAGTGLSGTYGSLAVASTVMIVAYVALLRLMRVAELELVAGPLLRRLPGRR